MLTNIFLISILCAVQPTRQISMTCRDKVAKCVQAEIRRDERILKALSYPGEVTINSPERVELCAAREGFIPSR